MKLRTEKEIRAFIKNVKSDSRYKAKPADDSCNAHVLGDAIDNPNPSKPVRKSA